MYLVMRDGFAVTRNGNDAEVALRLGLRPTQAQDPA
jgi:hypothetical protein